MRSFGGVTVERKEEEKESIFLFFKQQLLNWKKRNQAAKRYESRKGVGLHVMKENGSVGLFISNVGADTIQPKSGIATR